MSDNAIEIKGLSKMYRLYSKPLYKILGLFNIHVAKNSYQEFWALRGLDLVVPRGSRIGLIGRNGAGKSTLLKIIASNIEPTEGMVRINGKVSALLELGTGFHPEFTGRQNIRTTLAYQGYSGAEISAMEEDIIDFAELEEFIDHPLKTYSAGMYARLAFSASTAIKPEILIIDEVLGAGDAYFAGKCVERMRKLTDESGATVLFVSHDLSSVQALCNRIIWIDRGIIKSDGDPLSVSKLYMTAVRKDEQIRLKARDLKISRKQAVLLDSYKDIYQKLLFRFVGMDGGHPKSSHKIYALKLKCDDDEIGAINVGGPMDNHPDLDHYIMEGSDYMDWGAPMKDGDVYYRPYANFNGRYAHAPFEFSVPNSYLAGTGNFTLVIEAGCTAEEVAVDVFMAGDNSYHRLGVLKPGLKQQEFPFTFGASAYSEDALKNAPSLQNISSTDEYGSKEASITDVRIVDSEGKEAKILFAGEPFKVVLEYNAGKTLDNPVFVFCVYMPTGACASQWFAISGEMGARSINGKGKVIFEADSLLLGRGAYVASAAIFKHLPALGIEAPAYHLLDRCIHFQVHERDISNTIEYGICRQPIRARISAG